MEQNKVRNKVKSLSCVQLFAIPWTIAHQAPPSMEFSRQGYWSGLPFHSSGDLPDLGIEPGSLALWADALLSEPPGNPKYRNKLTHTQSYKAIRDLDSRQYTYISIHMKKL